MVRAVGGYVGNRPALGRPAVPNRRRRLMGATDKLKDKAQVAKGNVKTGVGRASDDPALETEGKADRVAGNLKQAGEKVKDALKH
jgi:uncharacterized protein YjbJ (UPF0337 family)